MKLVGCLWGMILVAVSDRQPDHYYKGAIVQQQRKSSANLWEV